MESIIEDLQTSDTIAKVTALERLLSELRRQVDLRHLETGKKLRLVNVTISAVKDANPKVVLLSLECVQLLVNNYKEIFQPSLNMTFEILLTKFGDGKESVRESAKATMLDIISDLGAIAGFERILSHLKHKNWKIREQLLHVMVSLLDIHGQEVAMTNDLTPQVCLLLTDPQSSIRSLVIEVLGRLYAVFGEVFMVELGSNSKIKPAHIRAIKDVAQSVEGQGGLEIAVPLSRVDSGAAGSVSSVSAQGSPSNSLSNGSAGGGSSMKHSIAKSKSDVASRLTALSTTGRSSSLQSKEKLAHTTGHMPISFSRNSSASSGVSGESGRENGGGGATAGFSPQWYMSLLAESKPTSAIYPSSEKDLMRIFTGVMDEIGRTEDWQARVTGLARLQALVTGICYASAGEDGDGGLKTVLVQQLKSTPVSELLCSQIVDLRSAVCKEACCAIATLARTLRNAFAPLAKLFITSLVKVLTQKIFVITSAADRCLRVVMSSPILSYYPKVVDIFLETISTSKNAEQRKNSFEYLTLAMAIWSFSDNLLDKMFDGFKKVIQDGVKDASGDVRKAARHLFWVLKSTPVYELKMDRLLESFDMSSKKHIKQELQTASEDFIELLNNPTSGLDDTEYTQLNPFQGKSNGINSGTSAVDAEEAYNSFGSSQERPQSGRNARSIQPPPLPVQSRPPSGPSRVNSNTSTSSSSRGQDGTAVSVSSGTTHATSGSTEDDFDYLQEFESAGMDTVKDRERGGVRGGARRTSMAPERVARPMVDSKSGSGLSHQPSVRNSSNRPLRLEMEAPPPPVLAISNSIRNKSAGRIALQSKQSLQDDDIGDVHQPQLDSDSSQVSATSRALAQTHSSGAQRIVVSQPVKKAPPPLPASGTVESKKPERMNTSVARQSQPRSLSSTLQTQGSSTTIVENTKASTVSVESSLSATGQGQGQGHSAGASISVSEIKTLIQDSHWEKRVQGFEAINVRFMKWLTAFHDPTSGTSNFPPYLEDFVDLCIHHLSDAHHKVVAVVGTALETLCRSKSNPLISHRLSQLLSTLLTRLGDRKASVRIQSNTLLDMIREAYEGPLVVASLSQRMAEVPERTRLTLVQFLSSLIPMCEVYFNNHLNMSAFLNRLVIVLGLGVGTFASSGQRASSALVIAGQRLLELLFNVSKESLLCQLAVLPLQQQTAMKKLMEGRLPNIDALVTQAGRQEWHAQAQSQQHPEHHIGISTQQRDDEEEDREEEEEECDHYQPDAQKASLSPCMSSANSYYDIVENDRIAELSKKLNGHYLSDSPQLSSTRPIEATPATPTIAQVSSMYSDDEERPLTGHSTLKQVDSLRNSTNEYMTSSPLLQNEQGGTGFCSPHGGVNVSPTSLGSHKSPLGTHVTPPSKALITEINGGEADVVMDVAWLLNVLRPDSQSLRADKKLALVELKKWTKTMSGDFWRLNSAQIISVLLEAFNPAVFSVHGPTSSGRVVDGSWVSVPQKALTGLSPVHTQAGALVEQVEGAKASSDDVRTVHMMEAMHLACKGLLIMVKLESGRQMEAFLDLLVSRLCSAAAFAPVAISLHCEQILSLASVLNPSRFARLLLPFISTESGAGCVVASDVQQHSRLLALHALSAAISHQKSSDLIILLPELTAVILPHFSSPMVDVRKSVVFVLVEAYMKVGDVLYPYVKELAASQRKLLTVYIERQVSRGHS